MLARIASAVAVFLVTIAPAEAARVALVVGQDAYTGLSKLANPRLDARRMAQMLATHGFEVIACDGTTPGCFDQTQAGLLAALKTLEAKSKGAGIRLGTMDRKIASIALARDGTLLSRNLTDFWKVPGLKVEDWPAPLHYPIAQALQLRPGARVRANRKGAAKLAYRHRRGGERFTRP